MTELSARDALREALSIELLRRHDLGSSADEDADAVLDIVWEAIEKLQVEPEFTVDNIFDDTVGNHGDGIQAGLDLGHYRAIIIIGETLFGKEEG